jgi:hypothetical protein
MQNYIVLTQKMPTFLCTYYFKSGNNYYYFFIYNLKGKIN